jgi:hypothetical protein
MSIIKRKLCVPKISPHSLHVRITFAVATCAALTACSTPPIPTANITPPKVNNADAVFAAQRSSGEHLTALHSLISRQDKPLAAIKLLEAAVENKHIHQRTAAQWYAMTGDERGTLELIDKDVTANSLAPLDVTGYTPQAAVEAIVAAAKSRQIVMLNENHTSQRQRAFALSVARALREAGFTHFGAEAFTQDIEKNMLDGAPKTTSGHYTLDPVFGDLARQVAKMGYNMFAYEYRPNPTDPEPIDQNAQIAQREQGQAENIKAVLNANPNARMFIYVGGSHASKAPISGNEWMGLRLQRMTGINPLTVDQNLGTPSARPERDGATYRGIASLGTQTQSIVLKNTKDEWLGRTGHDIVVFHPRVPDVAGRPGWLTMNGYRKPTTIKFAASANRTMVRAHVQGEPVNAIAMDQIIVPANQTEVTLMLPIGKYVITRQNEAGETTPLTDISVLL